MSATGYPAAIPPQGGGGESCRTMRLAPLDASTKPEATTSGGNQNWFKFPGQPA